MSITFIHLHLHSEYSIQNGLIRIKDLITKAKDLNMPAVALTDHMNMFATIKFYKQAIARGIKPIIGCEIEFCDDDSFNKRFRMVLLCKNAQGYRNLIKLLSNAYLNNQGDKPFVLKSDIQKYANGLIALSDPLDSDISFYLAQNKIKEAKKLLLEWQMYFENTFYLEIQRLNVDVDLINRIITLANATKTPLVATNNTLFMNATDYEAHQARVCIQEGELLSEYNKKNVYSKQQYFKSQEEMQDLFVDLPHALENTVNIAKRCSLILELGKPVLPDFPIPKEYTADSYLAKEAKEGLDKKIIKTIHLEDSSKDIKSMQKYYDQRLFSELKTISSMGYSGYFLIVYDFIKWAKDNNIPVGPGRGSGAGSLVAYALGITNIDPLKYDLLFERFLNPDRVSMPDFDIDFCMEGRDQVIEYVSNKYGKKNVSQIITFGTMAARAVVRDVGRIFGYPYMMVDKIAKLIPFAVGITLDIALKEEKLLLRYNEEEEVKLIIDLGKELEGITRNVGKHAGGVVMAPQEITHYMPIYCEPNSNSTITQYDKDDVESVGLVKFDFLGLKTLTIIKNALEVINSKLSLADQINIDSISMHDKKTFELICKCKTAAVFQLESRGMREIINRLKPDCFEDVVALVALFRPGPLQSGMVDDFISRKHGLSNVSYVHPDLEPILRETYGVILYQEQVMQIAQVIGGYSLGKADLLRRAMGKKQVKVMAQQREIFIQGAEKNKVKAEVAHYLFDLMEKFAGYGFNKSHSVAYAMIAYQTAWLKAHYPTEFMASVLSVEMENSDKIYSLINECKLLGIKISALNVNFSNYNFSVENTNTIRFGLGAVKGIGLSTIEMIIATREEKGKFNNFIDFCGKINIKKINRRNLEALIFAGAFDCIEQSRSQLIASLIQIISYAEKKQNESAFGQSDMFSGTHHNINVLKKEYVEIPLLELLKHEKSSLGFYFSNHPMELFQNDIVNMNVVSLAKVSKLNRLSDLFLTGFIVDIKKVVTRKNDNIYFVTLDDNSGIYDLIVFDDLFTAKEAMFVKNQVVMVKCLSNHDKKNNLRVRVVDINTIETIRQYYCDSLEIRVDQNDFQSSKLTELKTLIDSQNKGMSQVFLHYFNLDKYPIEGKILLNENKKIQLADPFVIKLYQLFGQKNIHINYDSSRRTPINMSELIK